MPERDVVIGSPSSANAWRASLSGVRGISILLVLTFHLGLPVANGGLGGVTVFFVLSGFLITTSLVNEMGRTGAIDLWAFYRRRARRLFPALFVAVAVVLLVSVCSGQGNAVVLDSVLAVSYLGNWARAQGDLMGMWNHAWSLAIEEQFYLLWPLALLAMLRWSRTITWRAVTVVLGIALGSAVLRGAMVAARWSEERVYFGSDTQAEALLAGCALALIVARGNGRHASPWVGPASLLTIIGLALMPNGVSPWPGAMPTLFTLSACGLILAASRADSGRIGLTARPVTWLGERSYSLYLWHVPVILFLAIPLAHVPDPVRIAIVVVVSVALAVASYELVERPFRRRGGDRSRRRAAVVSGLPVNPG